jgi:hypothetical protein
MKLADLMARHLRSAGARLSRRSLDSLLPAGNAIFLHRPHGQPCHGITKEVIRDFDRLAHLVLQNPGGHRYRVPDGVTFITYHNYKFKCLLERCYEAYGIRDFVVLGREVVRWDWSHKVRLVLDYLESGACVTPYVVCTDADDVLMVQDPGTLLDRFRSCSCDLLFCNTFVDFPPNKECRDFETLRYYARPLHCRLSAGAFVAEKEALVSCLRELVEACDENRPWAFYDGAFVDQLGWRHLHSRYYPGIRVDDQCLIFKRYDLFRDVVESP